MPPPLLIQSVLQWTYPPQSSWCNPAAICSSANWEACRSWEKLAGGNFEWDEEHVARGSTTKHCRKKWRALVGAGYSAKDTRCNVRRIQLHMGTSSSPLPWDPQHHATDGNHYAVAQLPPFSSLPPLPPHTSTNTLSPYLIIVLFKSVSEFSCFGETCQLISLSLWRFC